MQSIDIFHDMFTTPQFLGDLTHLFLTHLSQGFHPGLAGSLGLEASINCEYPLVMSK